MTLFARRILAVLAMSAVYTVPHTFAQQAFVSDIAPTSYQAAGPSQTPGYGPRVAQNYGQRQAQSSGLRQTQMEAEAVQPKRVADVASNGWGDEAYEGGSSDCGCSDGSCGSCGCGSCGSCCCGSHTGWYVGGAAVWAKPFFQHNTAFTTTEFFSNGVNETLATAQPFEYEYEATPRVWVGYENACGLGIRGRYWQFDHQARDISFEASDPTTVATSDVVNGEPLSISADPGDTLTMESKLKVQTVDLEATQRFNFCRSDVIGSFGVRYARLEQQVLALIVDTNSSPTAALARQQSFEGVGLTTALELNRKLGCCNLAFIGSARGSILFGQRHLFAVEFLEDDGTDIFGFTRREDEVLAIGEIMAGLEWSHCCCRGGRFYAQGVVEGQIWEGAGNASDSDSNLGFLGFGITAGYAR